jgi:hypothetical protein
MILGHPSIVQAPKGKALGQRMLLNALIAAKNSAAKKTIRV